LNQHTARESSKPAVDGPGNCWSAVDAAERERSGRQRERQAEHRERRADDSRGAVREACTEIANAHVLELGPLSRAAQGSSTHPRAARLWEVWTSASNDPIIESWTREL